MQKGHPGLLLGQLTGTGRKTSAWPWEGGWEVFSAPGSSTERKECHQELWNAALSGAEKEWLQSLLPGTCHLCLSPVSDTIAHVTCLRVRIRELKGLSQAHTACESGRWDLHRTPRPVLFTPVLCSLNPKSFVGKMRQWDQTQHRVPVTYNESWFWSKDRVDRNGCYATLFYLTSS